MSERIHHIQVTAFPPPVPAVKDVVAGMGIQPDLITKMAVVGGVAHPKILATKEKVTVTVRVTATEGAR